MAEARRKQRISPGHEQPALFVVPTEPAPVVRSGKAKRRRSAPKDERLPVVVCGSFRRQVEELEAAIVDLESAGCRILSPLSTDFVEERDGFVYATDQLEQSPGEIERAHLAALQDSVFVWLHAPEGYVGKSASLEIGFAHSAGIPVFARNHPDDVTIAELVEVVASPAAAAERMRTEFLANPGAALAALQRYYARAAAARGWDDESPRDCLLLLTEELGELARVVRRASKLARDGEWHASAEEELADVQLYLVHLANALGVDLAQAVRLKEAVNHERFNRRSAASA